MKIIIKETNLNLPDSVKKSFEDKMNKLNKFLSHLDENGVVELRLELAMDSTHHKKGNIYRAEINLKLPNELLRAEEKSHKINLAFNNTYKKIRRQVKKYKISKKDRIMKGAQKIKEIFRKIRD